MPNVRSSPELIVQQISDKYVQRNFQSLVNYFNEQNQLLDFKFFELVFAQAQTGYKIEHGLPYIPLDILVSRVTGEGIVTFRYDQFDTTSLVLDASGPCRIRFFAGTYSKLASKAATESGDSQQYVALPASVEKPVYTLSDAPLTSASLSSGAYPGSSGTRYVVRSSLDDYISADCSTGPQTLSLPLASSCLGRAFWIKKTDTTFAVATLSCASGDTIEGDISYTLNTPSERVQVLATEDGWQVLQHDYPRGWSACTFSGTWDDGSTTFSAQYRRNGDEAEFWVLATCSVAPPASAFNLTLPSGLTIDTTKLLSADTDLSNLLLGGMALDSAVAAYPVAEVGYLTTSTVRVAVMSTGGAYGTGNTLITNLVPFAFGAADAVSVRFKVPITGWKG